MKTVAGIDLGTQSIKVILYDYERHTIAAEASCPLELISASDGTREQKTQWYDAGLQGCFKALPTEARASIQAIGVSGQQHGFVPLDKEGNPLYNVKLWNDTSTQQECDILTKAAGGESVVIKEAGNLMLPGFTAPKILWLKNHQPQAWQKLHYILLPHDYVNFVLTGSYVMEYGDASGTALFDPHKRIWSKKLCDLIDTKLFSLLPPLIQAHEKAGTVSAKTAAWLGIPQGIPVSAGGGDNMMGAIGTGTVADGFLTMSLGTSGTLYGCASHCIADPLQGLSGFCSSIGNWLPLLCTMNCTVATEHVRELFNLSIAELDKLADSSTPGADGVTVLPFFNGERSPSLPNGRASIMGLHAANTNKENICRAAMESAVYAIRSGFEAFKTAGFMPKEIRLTGGGAKSTLWRQIVADVFDLPVKIPTFTESAALGAALQALWCLQGGGSEAIKAICDTHIQFNNQAMVMPNSKNAEAYKQAYSTYTKYLNALSPFYK